MTEAKTPLAKVEPVETVDYSTGFKQPADPIWRIEIDSYCTDFETQTAAQNFADAINRAFEAQERLIETLTEALEPFANGSVDVSGSAVIVGYPQAMEAREAARTALAQARKEQP